MHVGNRSDTMLAALRLQMYNSPKHFGVQVTAHPFKQGQVYRATTGLLIYIHAVHPSLGVLVYQFMEDFEETLADPTYVPNIYIRNLKLTSKWELVDPDFNVGKWLRAIKEIKEIENA